MRKALPTIVPNWVNLRIMANRTILVCVMLQAVEMEGVAALQVAAGFGEVAE